ncbi:probable G-protein coupled receptor 75 [Megalops cyprinoides]|uniref:probable G-protein coupled receptor 75 n=1 Tax=Megalops cyprinoides TaxID=118141 RepID=UPI0018642C90|nr:probable G-protein coupled receptor 75 [Megalops cyprinoides]
MGEFRWSHSCDRGGRGDPPSEMNSTSPSLGPGDVTWLGPYNATLGPDPSLGGVPVHTATLAFCSLLLLLIFCLGSYGNLVVVLSSFDPAVRKLRTSFDLMVLNLSLCDLLVCCVTAPMFALLLFLDAVGRVGGTTGGGSGGVGVSREFCLAFHLSSSGLVLMSLKTVAAIALQRLRVVLGRQPDRPAPFPCTLVLTALLWVSSFTLATLVTLRPRLRRAPPCLPCAGLVGALAGPALYLYLADFAFCVAVVTVSYAAIAHALHRNTQVCRGPAITTDATRPPPPLATVGFESVQCAVSVPVPTLYRNQAYSRLQQAHALAKGRGPLPQATASSGVNLATPKDSKAVLTCVAIVLSVLLCCLPLAVSLVWDFLSRGSDFLSPGGGLPLYQFELCGLALVLLKSGVNPFMYSRNSAGLRRRVIWCLRGAAPNPACCRRKTRLRAVGRGSLEANRNKSSHRETDSACCAQSPNRRRLVDQACGPSRSADSALTTPPTAGCRPRPPSSSTPANTRVEPYYSIYKSSLSGEPSSPIGSAFSFARPYTTMHHHPQQEALQDYESTSMHQIPIPSV